jgi:hypothetical protein
LVIAEVLPVTAGLKLCLSQLDVEYGVRSPFARVPDGEHTNMVRCPTKIS